MGDSQFPQGSTALSPIPPDQRFRETLGKGEQESALNSIVHFVALIRRHWMLVFAIAMASALFMYYRMRNEPRMYAATATVRLEDKARELASGMSRAPVQPYRPYNDPVLTQIEVLKSQAVAESVAEREGLRLRALPRLVPPNWARSVRVAADAARDTLHVAFSSTGVSVQSRGGRAEALYGQPISLGAVSFLVPQYPGISSAELTLLPLGAAANEVRSGLTGRERERTDIIDVTYTAPDPVLAQRVANAAVRVFQSYSAQTARQESQLRRQFIQAQLEKTEGLLAVANADHNAFRRRENVFSSQDKFKAQQADLTTLQTRRQDLLAERETYNSILDALQDPQSHGLSTEHLSALAASPVVSSNAVVSQLFTQLVSLQSKRDSTSTGRWANAATNPDVQRLDALIAATAAKVVSAAKANLSVLDVRIATLDKQKTDAAAAMATLPQAEATEAELLAQVSTYSRQVDHLRDELQSAEIDEAAQVGQIEILDMAQASGVPVGAGRRPKLVLALILGLALGTIVAYVLENYRPVIRRRDELEESLALPNLALVPQIRTSETQGNRLFQAARFLPARLRPANGNGHARQDLPRLELVTVSDARSSGAEAYRTLRTNLLFSAAVRAVSRIVVTSPGPEEGKSTTAANLAIAFAQQGRRVLLIDCDLRRARIHKIFEVASLPGLTTVLAGGLPVAEAIRPTRIEGLMILPSGPLPPNPAELLGSAQMNVLLDALSQSYDMLILDTPPLLAASDAAIVSRMSDGALVVVRAGRTERSALQAAVQQLNTVGARVLGTVLNDPDAEVPKYARYYGYYYNNYYDYPQAPNSKAQTVTQ